MSILDMINKDIEKSLCNTCSNKAMCVFALYGIVHQCKDYNKIVKIILPKRLGKTLDKGE